MDFSISKDYYVVIFPLFLIEFSLSWYKQLNADPTVDNDVTVGREVVALKAGVGLTDKSPAIVNGIVPTDS